MDQGILNLEEHMGLAPGFFERLRHADDWSFVIKLHALFEGACTHLLQFHFQEPKLADVFARLELSNKATGKIAFLERAELLGSGERRFITSLSELRNRLVHDVTNHEFSLSAMLRDYSNTQVKHFTITFNPWEEHIREMVRTKALGEVSDPRLTEATDLSRRMNDAKNNPKEFIWFGAHGVLVSIVDMHGYSDYRNWVKAKRLFTEDEDKGTDAHAEA